MKKTIFFAIALMLCSLFSFAQTEKGKIVVAGSSALSLQNNLESGDAGQTDLSLKPSVGYFVIDNLAINLGASIDYSKVGSFDPDVTTAIGPGLSYYFPTPGIVRPVVNASFVFASNKFTSTYDGQRYTINGFGYGGGAGAAIFLRENVSLDLGLQYLRLELSAPNTGSQKETANSLGLGLGLSIYF